MDEEEIDENPFGTMLEAVEENEDHQLMENSWRRQFTTTTSLVKSGSFSGADSIRYDD